MSEVLVTCAAIGKMGIPEMRKRGYPDEVALLTKTLMTVIILALKRLKCSNAFSLLLKAPRIVKTSGNIIAILNSVKSML